MKMNIQFIVLLSAVLLLYSLANYYVGFHFWQSFHPADGRLFWLAILLAAFSPFAARLARGYFPTRINVGLAFVGGYWLAATYYATLLWLVIDSFVKVTRWFGLPEIGDAALWGRAVVAVVSILLVYGTWNALHPRIRHYDVLISKEIRHLTELHAVMVSDIHLGPIVNRRRLAALVDKINQLEPEIVFLVGDIIDGDVNHFAEEKMAEILSRLKPRLGTYAVLGNHEYLSGDWEQAVAYLRQAGVVVLRDTYVKINDQFFLVGRDDRIRSRITGKRRMDLAEIMNGVDLTAPVILLDHQPYHLEEGIAQGVDLELSGHTHRGQIFPNNYITQWIFATDWGYLRQGDFQIIVSCGFGTWGPPIRIGNSPEIVTLTLSFGSRRIKA